MSLDSLLQSVKGLTQSVKGLLDPVLHGGAWSMVATGVTLYASHAQFASNRFFNLPELATMVELVGGMLVILGMQRIASNVLWPETTTQKLLDGAEAGSIPSAIVLAGLKVFNGLCVIGFAVWLVFALNGVR